jgi:hypothetical protein
MKRLTTTSGMRNEHACLRIVPLCDRCGVLTHLSRRAIAYAQDDILAGASGLGCRVYGNENSRSAQWSMTSPFPFLSDHLGCS